MSITVVATRNAPDRTRGFLASSMLEIGPGVYTAANLSVAVRDRIWEVIQGWTVDPNVSIIMVWADKRTPCGQSIRVLGSPPIELVEVDGIILAKKDIPPRFVAEYGPDMNANDTQNDTMD